MNPIQSGEAELIDSKRLSADDEIVLCKRKSGYLPYVTWRRQASTGDMYWGHYFFSIEEARMDFEERN
jgi:hypothetical protein